MLSNYPPGVSDSTPNAPWNQDPPTCARCKEELEWDEEFEAWWCKCRETESEFKARMLKEIEEENRLAEEEDEWRREQEEREAAEAFEYHLKECQMKGQAESW